MEFQSLLYWIRPSDTSLRMYLGERLMTFQSLLYWIRPSDLEEIEVELVATIGFNPCCIGLGLQTGQFPHQYHQRQMFQSLLYWIRPSDASRSARPMSAISRFNPCCIGLGLQTTCRGLCNVPATKCFNPCCIGLGLQTSEFRTEFGRTGQVSILVVLD